MRAQDSRFQASRFEFELDSSQKSEKHQVNETSHRDMFLSVSQVDGPRLTVPGIAESRSRIPACEQNTTKPYDLPHFRA